MRWYYVSNSSERLAAEESDLASLARSGAVRPQTMVWHDGLEEWTTCGEVRPEWFHADRMRRGDDAAALVRQAVGPMLAVWRWLIPAGLGLVCLCPLIMVWTLYTVGSLLEKMEGVVGALCLLLLGVMCFVWAVALRSAEKSGEPSAVRRAAKASASLITLAGVLGALAVLASALFFLGRLAGLVSGA